MAIFKICVPHYINFWRFAEHAAHLQEVGNPLTILERKMRQIS
jgi:hypothetical protein